LAFNVLMVTFFRAGASAMTDPFAYGG
jgi:hypothetical protein